MIINIINLCDIWRRDDRENRGEIVLRIIERCFFKLRDNILLNLVDERKKY